VAYVETEGTYFVEPLPFGDSVTPVPLGKPEPRCIKL